MYAWVPTLAGGRAGVRKVVPEEETEQAKALSEGVSDPFAELKDVAGARESRGR